MSGGCLVIAVKQVLGEKFGGVGAKSGEVVAVSRAAMQVEIEIVEER